MKGKETNLFLVRDFLYPHLFPSLSYLSCASWKYQKQFIYIHEAMVVGLCPFYFLIRFSASSISEQQFSTSALSIVIPDFVACSAKQWVKSFSHSFFALKFQGLCCSNRTTLLTSFPLFVLPFPVIVGQAKARMLHLWEDPLRSHRRETIPWLFCSPMSPIILLHLGCLFPLCSFQRQFKAVTQCILTQTSLFCLPHDLLALLH